MAFNGFGPTLAATFLANTGGDLRAFETADRLASVGSGTGAPRFRPHHRQSPSTPPFQPAPDEDLLPRGAVQPEK
jgi:hypothetical protein